MGIQQVNISSSRLLMSCILLLCILSGNAQKNNTHVAKHTNPVLDADFPDPTVINTNGSFYAYATQSPHNGKMINIQVASSPDMFTWKYLGDALPVKPKWANKTQDFWAPHVLYDSSMKMYVMFFCAKANDTTLNMGIGVALSNNPEGPFAAKDSPLLVAKGFANIDPMAMIDPQTGKKLLYWGSGFAPIEVRELNEDWSSFKENDTAVALLFPGKEKKYTNLIEGAWVDYYAGKFYLYYSGDNCCGAKANYAVMVARADSARGPFTTLAETNKTGSGVILEKDSAWFAPGHNSVFSDNKGNRYIAYHAIKTREQSSVYASGKSDYKSRVMCIEPVIYKNGWPVVVHKY